MNTYCALLLVEYTMSTGDLVSGVKLSFLLTCCGFGVSGFVLGKTENYELSCWKKGFETDILMYLVVIADHVSPVPGM